MYKLCSIALLAAPAVFGHVVPRQAPSTPAPSSVTPTSDHPLVDKAAKDAEEARIDAKYLASINVGGQVRPLTPAQKIEQGTAAIQRAKKRIEEEEQRRANNKARLTELKASFERELEALKAQAKQAAEQENAKLAGLTDSSSPQVDELLRQVQEIQSAAQEKEQQLIQNGPNASADLQQVKAAADKQAEQLLRQIGEMRTKAIQKEKGIEREQKILDMTETTEEKLIEDEINEINQAMEDQDRAATDLEEPDLETIKENEDLLKEAEEEAIKKFA